MKRNLIFFLIALSCCLINITAHAAMDDDGSCSNKGHLEGGGVGASTCQSCNFKICERITGWSSFTLTGKCVVANGCSVTNGCDGGRWAGTSKTNAKGALVNECAKDSDCSTSCKAGETAPHYGCDTRTNRCVIINKCGVSSCKPGGCCAGATNPHYVCGSTIPGSCEPVYNCGFSTCDNKNDTKECLSWYYDGPWYSSKATCEGYKNPKCTSYYCGTKWDWRLGEMQKTCIERLGKPPSNYFLNYSECAKVCVNPVSTTSTTKPSQGVTTTSLAPKITVPTTKSQPENYTSCRINYFSWSKYKKGSFLIFDSYPSYSLFTRPEGNILDNPKLEYTATNCNSCKLSVTSAGLNGVSGFVDNEGNKGVFGNQTYTEKTSNNRYVFDKSAFNQEGIVLDLSGVSTGSYNFVLSCNDFFTGETQEKTVKLNVHPYIRWREVAPILNKDE